MSDDEGPPNPAARPSPGNDEPQSWKEIADVAAMNSLQRGDPGHAVHLLAPALQQKEQAAIFTSSLLWIKGQLNLADLYRQCGRLADQDFPLLLRLQERRRVDLQG